MTEFKFTEEWIAAGDLEIDHMVQRTNLDLRKIERIKANFNPAALGVITVSKRNRVTYIVLDGMHRTRAVMEKFGHDHKLLCHVFENLAKAEEAQMFLDLNAGNQPNIMDKFKVRITAEDPVAIEIEKLAKAFGWTISIAAKNGHIQCVGTLERIYRRSLKAETEPNLLLVALMCVTHAWGLDNNGAQAVVLDGIASMAEEYGDRVNLEVFQRKLKNYPGGPMGLHTDATTLAALRRGRVTMAVAERLVDEYNKGKQSNKLHPWRRRS